MFFAVRSVRAAKPSGSWTPSRLPSATRMPDTVQARARIRLEAISITQVITPVSATIISVLVIISASWGIRIGSEGYVAPRQTRGPTFPGTAAASSGLPDAVAGLAQPDRELDLH